jgi:hypothetical protein
VQTLAEDTSPEAERVLVECWRKMTPAEKFAITAARSHELRESMMADLCVRYPDETPERLKRRLASLWLGEELAQHAYGPMPSGKGAGT